MQEAGLKISTLVTDRHPQISAVMKEHFPNINHQYGIWHLSKSLSKRLKSAACKKDCQELRLWTRSIINHLWWSAETCHGSVVNLKVGLVGIFSYQFLPSIFDLILSHRIWWPVLPHFQSNGSLSFPPV